MSADAWGKCPRCVQRKRDEHAARQAAVDAMYGKVPVEQFDAARKALPHLDDAEATLREEYEFYHEDGVLMVDYGAVCTECGFEIAVSGQKPYWPDDKPFEVTKDERST